MEDEISKGDSSRRKGSYSIIIIIIFIEIKQNFKFLGT